MDLQVKKLKQSNNKTNQEISEEIKYISFLINQDKFQEALERIKSYEIKNLLDA